MPPAPKISPPPVRPAVQRLAAPALAVQARPAVAPGAPAPHVQAATGRMAPAAPVPLQARPAPAPPVPAPHVRAAVQLKPAPSESDSGGDAKKSASSPAHLPPTQSGDFVVYDDRKTPGAQPPPPRWPVYALRCSDKGSCVLEDVKTGRTRPADSVYGGFVRMSRNGPVYVSPRPALGFPGDSHPTIAAGTPEGQRGKRAVVAAGEIGILEGQVVGHNDKTGHYQTRKNLYQAGLPAEKYHPFTQDPREWYRKGR
ncbi:MAG TPA: hypothetical protein VKK31_00500 [Thermoanaerobaculia bacterium]|nr:hypothetical protein [Thermoanaerobaculia bacterium]